MEWIQYLYGIGLLLLILSLLPMVAHFYRRFQARGWLGNYIKVVEVKPIGFKAQLLLVEVENRRFLLGLSEKGFTLIMELPNVNAMGLSRSHN